MLIALTLVTQTCTLLKLFWVNAGLNPDPVTTYIRYEHVTVLFQEAPLHITSFD